MSTTAPIRSYRVTPSLWVGEVPMCGGIPATTVEDALQVIWAGESAVLPHGYWATARDVLRALGVEEAALVSRIHYAQTATFPGA